MKKVIFLLCVLTQFVNAQDKVYAGYQFGFGTDYTNASNGAFIQLDNIGFEYDFGAYIDDMAYSAFDFTLHNLDGTVDVQVNQDMNWSPGGSFQRFGVFGTIPINSTYHPFEVRAGGGALVTELLTMDGTRSKNSLYFSIGGNLEFSDIIYFTTSYVWSDLGNQNTFRMGVGFRLF